MSISENRINLMSIVYSFDVLALYQYVELIVNFDLIDAVFYTEY